MRTDKPNLRGLNEKGGFYVEGLDKWVNWLKTVDEKEIAKMLDRILRTLALRGLEYLHDFTPRRTGGTAGSFTVGGEGNVLTKPYVNVKGTSSIRFGSALPHVGYLNDGFQQRRGQFVPGEWKSGTFHYDPDKYPEGMVLTGKYIEGAHMFEKALQYLEEDDIEKVILFELKRLWAALGNSGAGPA